MTASYSISAIGGVAVQRGFRKKQQNINDCMGIF